MKVELPDGTVISGTEEKVRSILRSLGMERYMPMDPRYFYKSESRGWMRITDMETTHLRNAILKMYSKWVDGLHGIENPLVFVRTVLDGYVDVTFVAMLQEMTRRVDETDG